MSIDLTMPKLGESVVEGTVTKWLVREGDLVEREQSVCEVATDKADTEVPAPAAGRVSKILVGEGAVVKVGAPLCQIDTDAKGEPAAKVTKAASKKASAPPAAAAAAAPAPAPSGAISTGHESLRVPPSVRKLARELGVAAADAALARLGGVAGSGGPDPERYPVPNVGYRGYKVPAYRPQPGDQVVPFTRRRRLTADHMVYSKLTSPHVVTVAEVDLARTMKLREAHKDRYKKEGVGLTVLAFVCAAAVRALREFPDMNSRVLEGEYVRLANVNLGVAVDAPDGLIVPNIKRAEDLGVRGLAKAIDDVAKRARDGKIGADDLAGSSFSISNPGLKGNLFGGAIISQPNVGILRMGEIQKRVVVVDEGGEDRMVIHPVMLLALSYDHRIIDGALANGFLWRVTELLEKGDFEV